MGRGLKSLLPAMITGYTKTTGKTPDVVVVGTDLNAEEVEAILIELGLDMTVIADNEISSRSAWVMCVDDLGHIPKGGQN